MVVSAVTCLQRFEPRLRLKVRLFSAVELKYIHIHTMFQLQSHLQSKPQQRSPHCLSAVSDSVKLTFWSPLTRNSHYNDLSHWQRATFHRVPTAQLKRQQKGNPKQTAGSSTQSASPEKQSSSVAQTGYLTCYYPVRYASLTV